MKAMSNAATAAAPMAVPAAAPALKSDGLPDAGTVTGTNVAAEVGEGEEVLEVALEVEEDEEVLVEE